jgi:two-component system probable response regulator PhcQ
MEDTVDYKRFAILYVDDEEKSLKYFARAFEDQFRVFTAASAREGLDLLTQHRDEIGLLMTDQRMPGEKGTWLLDAARQRHPRIVRILATAFADMDAAIAAVNTGAIYKYVTKPWDPPQLETTLKRGLELFVLQRERDQLLQERMATLRNMMVADRVLSLGLLASGLSHHIKNALVSVKTFLDLTPTRLEEEGVNLRQVRHPDFWRDYYSGVQAQLARVSQMLSELAAISELPPYRFADRVRLSQVVRDALERLAAELAAKNIGAQTDIPDDLPELTVDRPRFSRIFELLLRDEAISLPHGAQIRLAARVVPGPEANLPVMQVTFSDNGPGLSEEALQLVFNPFLLRADSPQEYGINLMTVYFLVHHHGGRIEARNEPGGGTTFTIHLPVNASESSQSRGKPESTGQSLLNESLWEQMRQIG